MGETDNRERWIESGRDTHRAIDREWGIQTHTHTHTKTRSNQNHDDNKACFLTFHELVLTRTGRVLLMFRTLPDTLIVTTFY